MGRISKRKGTSTTGRTETSVKKIFKTALYARLSSDQDEKKNESIDVQIAIGRKFAEEFNEQHCNEKMEIVDCYQDLGKTGVNFKRDEFQRLMQDVRLGDINCIIVKDLSRFGRNYLEAGNYIEKIFPFLGVRFIAVADGYDTGADGNETKQMATEIKNLVNDMYAKDFSVKARVHLKKRREEGSYVGGPPPYGYVADWKEKKRVLVPDENTADIVRLIFRKFVEAESYAAVTDMLNEMRFCPPAVYKKTGEVYAEPEDEYKGWDKSSIERIVKSRTYIGTLEQGKTSITAHDESNRIHKEKEDWVIRENVHDAILTLETFEKAQAAVQKIHRKKAGQNHPTHGYPLEEDLFDSVLFCGACGRKMTRNSYVKEYADGRKERKYGYFCLNAGSTKMDTCTQSNRISKVELLDILLPLMQKEFACYLDRPKSYTKIGQEKLHEAELAVSKKIRDVEAKLFLAKEEETEMYMEYRTGKIEQKDFVAYKLRTKERCSELEKQKIQYEQEQKGMSEVSERYLKAIRSLTRLKSGKNLTKEMIEALIEKIYVYPGKRMEVIFQYTNEML